MLKMHLTNFVLKVLAMNTLSSLVSTYPSLHRTLQTQLSSLALRFLNGSAPRPTPRVLQESASGLYAVLHHTGGKVGGANQWRKAVEDTLAFARGAFLGLRTTFSSSGKSPLYVLHNDSNN